MITDAIQNCFQCVIKKIREWRTDRLIKSSIGRFCNTRSEMLGYKLKREECTPDKIVWIDPEGNKITLG